MLKGERTVLVTGATGRRGRVVISSLRRHEGWHARALTRDAGSEAAQHPAYQGIEVVQGDLEPALFRTSTLPCNDSEDYDATLS